MLDRLSLFSGQRTGEVVSANHKEIVNTAFSRQDKFYNNTHFTEYSGNTHYKKNMR